MTSLQTKAGQTVWHHPGTMPPCLALHTYFLQSAIESHKGQIGSAVFQAFWALEHDILTNHLLFPKQVQLALGGSVWLQSGSVGVWHEGNKKYAWLG